MSSTLSSANLPARRKRILMQAWHRGTKEMDLILGRFVDSALVTMAESDLEELELICDMNDIDLYNWISGVVETPLEVNTAFFKRIKASALLVTFK